MKFKLMIMSLLDWATFKEKDNKVDITDEDDATLVSLLGEDNKVTLIDQVNAELAGVADFKTQLQNAQQVATTAQQETAVAVEAKATAETKLSALESKVAELTATVSKLSDDPETIASVAKVS